VLAAPLLAAVADPPRALAPRPASPRQMRWWRDARFGLFIHWGPASVAGVEISWARIGHPHDHPGHESVPAEEYDNLYRRFNPVRFDPDAWMRLAKEAGMRYVVFVTKHHDGFCLWPTKQTNYNILATPYPRDLCRMVAEAARRHGLRLGWYYSTRDWTHPDYLAGDNAAYNAYYEAQVRELLTDYGRVDILWFDHVAGNWRDYDFGRLFRSMYALQPDLLVNDRAARFIRPTEDAPPPGIAELVRGDFDTPEQRLGAYQTDRAWESCVTLTECPGGGGWSYRPDGRTRSAEECVRMLVTCAVGDGNLLLNVGPLPTGEMDPGQASVLRDVGRWLRKHGRAIYGTRGGPIPAGPWGGTTHRGARVWLHVTDWSALPERLPALPGRVAGTRCLTGGQVTLEQDAGGLRVDVPAADRDPLDTIIEIALERPPVARRRSPRGDLP